MPFYGVRQLTWHLQNEGHAVNEKRIRRLMRVRRENSVPLCFLTLRTAKFAVAQPVATVDRRTAWEFLQHMLGAVPCQVHTVLTGNGIQFAVQPRNRNTITSRPIRFDMICEGRPRFAIGPRTVAGGIEHRLTKPNHPWSHEDQTSVQWTDFPGGGQVERMNRAIKEATVKRFHYDSHLADFMAVFNLARRLKTLGGLTPNEYICKVWTSEPDRFILDPIHHMPGLNT